MMQVGNAADYSHAAYAGTIVTGEAPGGITWQTS